MAVIGDTGWCIDPTTGVGGLELIMGLFTTLVVVEVEESSIDVASCSPTPDSHSTETCCPDVTVIACAVIKSGFDERIDVPFMDILAFVSTLLFLLIPTSVTSLAVALVLPSTTLLVLPLFCFLLPTINAFSISSPPSLLLASSSLTSSSSIAFILDLLPDPKARADLPNPPPETERVVEDVVLLLLLLIVSLATASDLFPTPKRERAVPFLK